MRLFNFPRKTSNEKHHEIFPLKTVVSPGHLYKASGALPGTPGVRHTLLCSGIPKSMRETMLAEGFRAIGGASITHAIFCTFVLTRDAGSPRCLFNLYLDLGEYPPLSANWIAKQITASRRFGGLRRFLMDATSPGFLIRCKNHAEFPFCFDDEDIDKYWLLNANVLSRAIERAHKQATR